MKSELTKINTQETDLSKSEDQATTDLSGKTLQDQADNQLKQEDVFSTDINLRYVLFWGVILGLMMNWMGMYLKISMGFVSVGIGPMAVLLISRQILRRRNAATRKNLTMIIIAYGATQAAEAAVGLLFLLWLATHASFFGMTFNPPWWLLPPDTILNSRSIFSATWIVPLLVHYFLMLIPGFLGIILGWYIKDSFIEDEDSFPFPSVISQNASVAVLTDEAETKGPIFWRIARWSFLISLLTVFIPGLYVIDFSSFSAGYIIGIMLGPVGLALFAAGILIGKPKISISPMIVSIMAYTIFSQFFATNVSGTDFFDFFNLLLQDYYFVPAISLMIGGLILGPIFWSIISSIGGKQQSQEPDDETEVTEHADHSADTTDDAISPKTTILSVLRKNSQVFIFFGIVYFLLVFYVTTLQVIPAAPLWVIAILIFWNIVIGGLVNGYLVTMGVAKSSSALSPPFIFDVIPIFLAGGAGFTSFVAMPSAETDGTAGVVSSQKLAMLNDISPKRSMLAYITGYLATSITTPMFALLMWRSFGIGTAKFPAPAFPVQGAILASFASRDISSFIDIQLLIICLVAAILLSKLGNDLLFGLVIGLLFPPHMAIPMALGGLFRIFLDRRQGIDQSKETASTVGPAISVGASFVIPILIIVSLL